MRRTGGREAIQFGGLIDIITGRSRRPHPVQQEAFGGPDLPQNVEMPGNSSSDVYSPYLADQRQEQKRRLMEQLQVLEQAETQSSAQEMMMQGNLEQMRQQQRQQNQNVMQQFPKFSPEPGTPLYDAIMNPSLRGEFNITPQGWADLERRALGVR
jgi:hypothetical protein